MSNEATFTGAITIILAVVMSWFAIIYFIGATQVVERKVEAMMSARNYTYTPLQVEPTTSTWENIQPAIGVQR